MTGKILKADDRSGALSGLLQLDNLPYVDKIFLTFIKMSGKRERS
jgi:hypothetical protein